MTDSASALEPAVSSRLLGVVLCGGRSSRMGRDKASLPHPQGGSFLQHAITRLTGLCDRVAVSGATEEQHNAIPLPDPIAHRGPATGIATALRFASAHGCQGCLITPIDMPLLTRADLQLLCLVWQQVGTLTVAHSAPLLSHTSQPCDRSHNTTPSGEPTGSLEPLVAIYPTALAEQLDLLAASEDRSLMRWILSRPFEAVKLPAVSCRNINTPDDLSHDV